MTSPHLDLRGATARRRSAWPLGGSGTTATTMCATARFQLDLRAVTARRRSALRATEVRMYPRSGPRTDGRCAEGPRVEWLDGEARPTDDPARGAERPDRTTPPQLFLKPYLCVAWWRVERLDGEARPTDDPAAVPNGLPVRPHNNFSASS